MLRGNASSEKCQVQRCSAASGSQTKTSAAVGREPLLEFADEGAGGGNPTVAKRLDYILLLVAIQKRLEDRDELAVTNLNRSLRRALRLDALELVCEI